MERSIERVVQRPAQPGMVGDGFQVYNYIPGTGISAYRISPFLMLDFNPEHDFGPSLKPLGVEAHPHKGFETVTIVYQGSVAHSDSLGNHGVVRAGETQWMTAGSGIIHKEHHEEKFSRSGGPFEVVQLWVNLPREFKSVSPRYQTITDATIGVFQLPEHAGQVRVIAGTFADVAGPAKTYTPVSLFNLYLNAGKSTSFTLPQAENAALLLVNGALTVNGSAVASHELVLFGNDGDDIHVEASEASVALVLSGSPINEPIASYGPFVLNTQAEIREAIMDYNLGKFGALD